LPLQVLQQRPGGLVRISSGRRQHLFSEACLEWKQGRMGMPSHLRILLEQLDQQTRGMHMAQADGAEDDPA
jgi:hypothetical protein